MKYNRKPSPLTVNQRMLDASPDPYHQPAPSSDAVLVRKLVEKVRYVKRTTGQMPTSRHLRSIAWSVGCRYGDMNKVMRRALRRL